MFRRPHQYCIFWVCSLDLNGSSRFTTGVMNNNENLFFIDQRRLSKRDLINSVILIALGKVMKIDINIKFVLNFILKELFLLVVVDVHSIRDMHHIIISCILTLSTSHCIVVLVNTLPVKQFEVCFQHTFYFCISSVFVYHFLSVKVI